MYFLHEQSKTFILSTTFGPFIIYHSKLRRHRQSLRKQNNFLLLIVDSFHQESLGLEGMVLKLREYKSLKKNMITINWHKNKEEHCSY